MDILASPLKQMCVHNILLFLCFWIANFMQIKVINEYLAEGGELAKLGAVDRAFLKVNIAAP